MLDFSRRAAAAALFLTLASPASAASGMLFEVEPNDTFASAQFIETGLGGSNFTSAAFLDGVVEGTGEGLFDYFRFTVAPFENPRNPVFGNVGATGRLFEDGTRGEDPIVVLFDSAGNQLSGREFRQIGTYTVAVGRAEGSVASAYRLSISALAVPEPTTWALMLAGFGLVGYAMRRRAKVAFA